MNFFNIPPEALPADAQYYFNIMVILILMPVEELSEEMGIINYWNIEHINDPRPYVLGIIGVEEEELDEDEETPEEEWSELEEMFVELHPHCVVEVHPELGVSWTEMYDDEGEIDLWRI